MKPLKIKLLSFDEAKFEYNKKIGILTDDILSDIRIIFDPVLSYREDADVLGVQLTVNYLYKSTVILAYGVALTIAVDEYTQAKAQGTDIKEFLEQNEAKTQLFDLAKGFLRGALAIRSKDTIVAKLFLPIFDSSDMAAQLKIIKVK